MTILAIDTTGPIGMCAVMRDGEIVAKLHRDAMLDHSSNLLPAIEDMLKQNRFVAQSNTGEQASMDDIDCFAVAVGPGSFTGIRIGIATIMGFCWATDKPSCGISSLEAMAYDAPVDGKICARITSRPGEYYYAFFEKNGENVKRLCPDSVGNPDTEGALVLTDAQSAVGVAKAAHIATMQGLTIHHSELRPSYLKLSQAERLLLEKEGAKKL